MAAPPRDNRHKPHFHRNAPVKEPVRAASASPVTISTGLNAGDSFGGVTLADLDRVLLMGQTLPKENGIYVAGATPARAYDFETDGAEAPGSVVLVLEGTLAGTAWYCSNTTAPTFGTDDVTFEALTAGAPPAASSGGFDVTPAQSVPMPAWVKPTGSGVITADPQGRINVMTGTGYKSFPGMTFLEGRLHLVYRTGSAHNSGATSLDHKWSDDLGRTWLPAGSAISILTATGSDDYRDPNITALSSGRLLLSYDTRNPYSSSTAIIAYTGYSDDRGQTWTTGILVDAGGATTSIASAQALELPDGTVLLPGFVASGGLYTAVVWKSTDGGLTFGDQVTIATGTRDWEEPVIRLLASGKLVCLIRSSGGTVTYRAVSTDLGATWGAASSVLTAGGRPDFVEFYPGALLLFCRTDNTTNFDPRWAVSWDEGATWTALQEIDSGVTTDLEYSAPVVLAPGYVAVVYSLENSSSDADLYLRYYRDGYGIDPLGQGWFAAVDPSDPGAGTAGRILISDTHSSPMVFGDLMQNEDGSDLLYADT